jgi:hypothetical protein
LCCAILPSAPNPVLIIVIIQRFFFILAISACRLHAQGFGAGAGASAGAFRKKCTNALLDADVAYHDVKEILVATLFLSHSQQHFELQQSSIPPI